MSHVYNSVWSVNRLGANTRLKPLFPKREVNNYDLSLFSLSRFVNLINRIMLLFAKRELCVLLGGPFFQATFSLRGLRNLPFDSHGLRPQVAFRRRVSSFMLSRTTKIRNMGLVTSDML